MKFLYTSGSRPLDGYTLKRGIGRGGFGEVYFALSDGGKEVALKLVRGDQQVELRGVAQCLNLKHPNLVALYDLRTDDRGDNWVVMEYVAGESLDALVRKHPNGVPRELIREWFLGLGRAVAYLHDQGIVHRDLKPANVFVENGVVKVGDYGLAKSIGGSRREAQTQSVGTVHYMAPEISTGNYNRRIDIYAAGVMLYEMAVGKVPFEGESAGEILMKHLTAAPDTARVPDEWRPIVEKALAKNPNDRYETMTDMLRDVERVGQAVVVADDRPTLPAPARKSPSDASRLAAMRDDSAVLDGSFLTDLIPAVSLRQQLYELSWSMVVCVGFAGLATLLWVAVRPEQLRETDWPRVTGLFFLTVAASWAILVPSKFWTERKGDSWTRRLMMLTLGGCVGLLACWLDGYTPAQVWRPEEAGGKMIVKVFPSHLAAEASYFCYYAAAFFVLRWWRMTSRRRQNRFSFAPVFGAGFWGAALLLLIRPPHPVWSGMAALVLVMAAAIVQLVSPWEEPPEKPAKRLRLRYA